MGENFKVFEWKHQVFGDKRSGSCHSTVLSGKDTVKKKERLSQTVLHPKS